MSGAPAKPLPKSDPTTAPYWESVKNEAMAIQFSPATGKYIFYPRGFDPAAPDSVPRWSSAAEMSSFISAPGSWGRARRAVHRPAGSG